MIADDPAPRALQPFAIQRCLFQVVQSVTQMSKTELLSEAQATREEASRAKRLARTLTQDEDRSRLLEYAEALEDRAEALERDAACG